MRCNSRIRRKARMISAYERALRIWNDGTGRLGVRQAYKPVQHPYYKLPTYIRSQLGWTPGKLDRTASLIRPEALN